jgi:quinolinate synthase
MRLNTLEKVYNSLRYEYPQVEVDAAVAAKAIKPIERMLALSEDLKR